MSGATAGQGAPHPLDLAGMAAFAANYGLSGDQAARRWATAVKNVREHFRMVADAAITAGSLAAQEPRAADGLAGTPYLDALSDALTRKVTEAEAERDQARADRNAARNVVAEMLDSFGPSGSGHTARVGQVQIARWRTRSGLTPACDKCGNPVTSGTRCDGCRQLLADLEDR